MAYLKTQFGCHICNQGTGGVGLRVLGVVCCTAVVQRHVPELDLQAIHRVIRRCAGKKLLWVVMHQAIQRRQGPHTSYRQSNMIQDCMDEAA